MSSLFNTSEYTPICEVGSYIFGGAKIAEINNDHILIEGFAWINTIEDLRELIYLKAFYRFKRIIFKSKLFIKLRGEVDFRGLNINVENNGIDIGQFEMKTIIKNLNLVGGDMIVDGFVSFWNCHVKIDEMEIYNGHGLIPIFDINSKCEVIDKIFIGVEENSFNPRIKKLWSKSLTPSTDKSIKYLNANQCQLQNNIIQIGGTKFLKNNKKWRRCPTWKYD